MASLAERTTEALIKRDSIADKSQADMASGELTASTVNLAGFIKEKLVVAETARQAKEDTWLAAYRNYRGVYGPEVVFSKVDQCRVFVKITKTKVIAAYGQLIDVLSSTGKFPIVVAPTEKPDGIAEYAHLDQEGEQAPTPADVIGTGIGWEGDGKSLAPGATFDSVLGGLKTDPVLGQGKWKEGPSPDKMKTPQISPAKIAADKMQKVILDQLDETNATTKLRDAVFECVMLGTGIIKGPFSYEKVAHTWQINAEAKDGEPKRVYAPLIKLVPRCSQVSVWDFYPDPSARTSEEMSWCIERYHFNESAMRDLMNRPLFDKDAISRCIAQGPNYENRTFESELRPMDLGNSSKLRYEVLEYWGTLDRATLWGIGEEFARKYDIDPTVDEVQVNIWTCGTEVIRFVLNPFTPARIPYHIVPFEKDPYSIWGIGLAENMEDSQTMMNGFARMTVDNLRYSGNIVFDIDESALVPGQEFKIEPGQIFRRQQGQPGQAVFGVKFPNTAQENLLAFDRFRQFADEETGIPSYSHGATGVTSTTRTASGMSMLMGAAALSIKTVIKNIDDYLLRPLGEAYYHWNMQFNDEDLDIRGDIEVKASGTAALMMKEVRSQRLTTLMQVGTNPQVAPFLKWNTLLKELAISLDIAPDEMIANPEEAAMYAAIVGKQNAQGQSEGPAAPGQQPPMGGAGGLPPGANPNDPTGSGGGNIGTGSIPVPGTPGFSANTAAPQG